MTMTSVPQVLLRPRWLFSAGRALFHLLPPATRWRRSIRRQPRLREVRDPVHGGTSVSGQVVTKICSGTAPRCCSRCPAGLAVRRPAAPRGGPAPSSGSWPGTRRRPAAPPASSRGEAGLQRMGEYSETCTEELCSRGDRTGRAWLPARPRSPRSVACRSRPRGRGRGRGPAPLGDGPPPGSASHLGEF